ncbi:hypothetical protein ACHAP5_005161 [Fusarium lateritium]
MADGQTFNEYNVSFMSCLLMAKKAVNEEPIQILWNTILGTWFPPLGPRSYKLAIKSPTLANNDEPDGIVIEVRFVGHGPVRNSDYLVEHQIFMVECKGSESNTPRGWAIAADQLTHYLENNINGSRKLFGAVAIGTLVEVYEWEYENQRSSLRPIHNGRLDLRNAGDRITFEGALNHVQAQGWAHSQLLQ